MDAALAVTDYAPELLEPIYSRRRPIPVKPKSLADIIAAVPQRQAEERDRERKKLLKLSFSLGFPGCEVFEDKRISTNTEALIEAANEIIEQYAAQGFTLTLRQLFYQFVSRELLPNTQSEYKRLGNAVSDGRNLGLIRWDRIEDRTRYLRTHPAWIDPADAVSDAASRYQEDLWRNQRYRPEVWIEKDALVGIIEGPCREWRVPYFSNRGYCSEPLLYQAAKRFEDQLDDDLTPIILHLGDHDPSGLQMTQNIRGRLWTFTRGYGIEVRRLALNQDQTVGLPPNLVKDSDTRSAAYKDDYGDECFELDALDPSVIVGLINDAVSAMVDRGAWDAALAQEAANRDRLVETAKGMRA